jgi:hypothetical protein
MAAGVSAADCVRRVRQLPGADCGGVTPSQTDRRGHGQRGRTARRQVGEAHASGSGSGPTASGSWASSTGRCNTGLLE